MLDTDALQKIKKRGLEITAEIELRVAPFFAEVITDVSPRWHVIETWPGQEMKAIKFLMERQFGVFLPKFADDASLKLDGEELCGGRRLIFPGHVFIFVWDILHHWRRVRACPGVARVLMDRSEHPVVVPDGLIDRIQALQFGLSPTNKGKKKSRKAKHQQKDQANEPVEHVRLTCRSHWHDLAPDERISLLHKALGLETITAKAEDSTVPS